mgnify:CR=1 FL=1
MIALILLLSFGVALAQNKPAPVAPKPVEIALTAEDRESVLQLKSRMDDQFRIQKQAEEAQAKLGQELQRKLLELGKKCGGTVGLTPEKHEVICQKPEPPKKE